MRASWLLSAVFFWVSSVGAAPLSTLPPSLMSSWEARGLDGNRLVAVVEELPSGKEAPVRLLSVNPDRPIAPASTAKLITTLAALEWLGVDYTFNTQFWASARPNRAGQIGNLYIEGGGDPTWVIENFVLSLERLRQLGVKTITGNVVIDRSLFLAPQEAASDFDGQAHRPYNTLPDAAIVNYGAMSFELVPDEKAKVARVIGLPELAGVSFPKTIPLLPGPCGDWKKGLGFSEDTPGKIRFKGGLPLRCGPKIYSVVGFQANDYWTRLFKAQWAKVGGVFKGRVVSGERPQASTLLMTSVSSPLSEIVKYTNKFSNNLLARHLFLALGERAWSEAVDLSQGALPLSASTEAFLRSSPTAKQGLALSGTVGSIASSRPRGLNETLSQGVLEAWMHEYRLPEAGVFVDNGSGLSRKTRVTGDFMAALLAHGWQSPYMSEYLSSLPVSAVDGTMARREVAPRYGRIKTGLINNVRAIGGYIHAKNGRRYAIFASIEGTHHLSEGIGFLNDLITWVYENPHP